jgi:hypothetical protein
VLPQVTRNELVDLLVARASLEPPLDCEREHRDRDRRRLRVERADTSVPELGRGGSGTLERSRQIRRDVQREDALVRAELLVDGEKVGRGRLRRRRQLARRTEPLVELAGGELDAVLVALGAEGDVEGHDAPVRKPLARIWEVCGRVEHDRGVRRRQPHAAARLSASTITSSSWSFVRQSAAPAS